MSESQGGIVRNKPGYPKVAGLTRHSPGGTAAKKVVGVLVGATADKLGSDVVHIAHILQEDAFPREPEHDSTAGKEERQTRGQRATGKKGEVAQERFGWHTFRRSDKVEYTHKQEKEGHAGLVEGESFEAVVYGVVYHEGRKQDRKFLLLHDTEADTFFVGKWTQWRRLPKYPGSITFNTDALHAEVKTLSAEEGSRMVASFTTSTDLCHLTTDTLIHKAAEGNPPRLKVERDRQKKLKDSLIKENKAAATKQVRLKASHPHRARMHARTHCCLL